MVTPNIGLTITPRSDDTKKFIDFRTEIAGSGSTSNMVIIDTEIGDIKTHQFTWGDLKNGMSD